MDVVMALLAAASALTPEIAAAMPAVEALVAGQKVTTAQMVSVWQAVQALETLAAQREAAALASAPQPGA